MTIICGTDFSERSRAACLDAAALAHAQRSRLILVHAIATPVTPGAETGVQQLLDSVEKELSRLAAELRETGIEVEEKLSIGSADEAIASLAAEVDDPTIVVSATSRPKTRWLLGSTADRVASSVEAPILVLRENFPLREWVDGNHTLRVMVATDLSPVSDDAIAWAAGLSQIGKCAFVLAHVSWPPEVFGRLAIEGPMPLDRTHPIVEKVVRRELEQMAERFRDAGPCEIVIESSLGRPADSLNRIAVDEKVDLLVVGHHADRLWSVWEGSVARGVMRTADMSVACVPDTVSEADHFAAPSFGRVVVATDLSRSGNAAVAYALSAVSPDGEVILAHVLDDPADDDARARVRAELEALIERPRPAAQNVRMRVELLDGEEHAQEICALAEREAADLICLGSTGRSRLPRILFGSVAQEVLLTSRKPVLIIPSAATIGA